MRSDSRPLVAHVIHRFAVGGLENGLVNLLNRMDTGAWRHAVIALDTISDDMRSRVLRQDVEYIALEKPPGHLYSLYPRLMRLLRRLAPAVVHTRNLGALEAVVPAWLAGSAARVHGEHGWDVNDVGGVNRKYQLVRRLYSPLVHHYVALSEQIAIYLRDRVGVSDSRISTICNGVDTTRFRPRRSDTAQPAGLPAHLSGSWLVGTVGRLQAIKDQRLLVRAFARAVAADAGAAQRMALVIVGEGPARSEIEAEAAESGVRDRVWLAGERSDVPELMSCFDLFCLPSRAEGISNTILEAMACGLPVLATRVGGNTELVQEQTTGRLFAAGDAEGLAGMLLEYFRQPAMGERQGSAGRGRVERSFSLDAMVRSYEQMYSAQLLHRGTVGARLERI